MRFINDFFISRDLLYHAWIITRATPAFLIWRKCPFGGLRHSGRDCRNLDAIVGNAAMCTNVHSCHPIAVDSPPCVLDTGSPCRYDGGSSFRQGLPESRCHGGQCRRLYQCPFMPNSSP